MNQVLALQKLTCTSARTGVQEVFFTEPLFEETVLMSSASGICATTGVMTKSRI